MELILAFILIALVLILVGWVTARSKPESRAPETKGKL